MEKSNNIPRVLLDGDEEDETLEETPQDFTQSDINHSEESRNNILTNLNHCETEQELLQYQEKTLNNDRTSCPEEKCNKETDNTVKVAASLGCHGDISKDQETIRSLEEKTSAYNAAESNPSNSTKQANVCQDFEAHSTSQEGNMGLTFNHLPTKEGDTNYHIQGTPSIVLFYIVPVPKGSPPYCDGAVCLSQTPGRATQAEQGKE